MHARHGQHGDSHRPRKKGKGSHPHQNSSAYDHDELMAELDADAEIPGDLTAALAGLTVNRGNEGLNAKVLVLNKGYAAMRVVSARRAFILLSRAIAEVIHVEPSPAAGLANAAETANGGFVNYDLESWIEISQLQREFEPDRHDWVRTVRMEIAVPRIIRLLGYDRLPEQTVKLNRRNLFARDRNRCQYCGRIFPTNDLSIDHVLPRAQGGGDSWENLVCACIKCNARKGGRTPDQAHMKLVKKPERPKRNPLIALKLGHEKYASWKTFLDHAYWDVELR